MFRSDRVANRQWFGRADLIMAFGGLDDVGDGLYTRRTDRDFAPVKSEQFFLG